MNELVGKKRMNELETERKTREKFIIQLFGFTEKKKKRRRRGMKLNLFGNSLDCKQLLSLRWYD